MALLKELDLSYVLYTYKRNYVNFNEEMGIGLKGDFERSVSVIN